MHVGEAAAVFEEKLGLGGIDYLFVDGLHTYGAVVADISRYLPLVRPGGEGEETGRERVG